MRELVGLPERAHSGSIMHLEAEPLAQGRADLDALPERLGLPEPRYAWRVFRTSTLTWLALRFIVAVAVGSAADSAAGMTSVPDWRAAAITVCVPVGLALLDRRIFREGTFYLNLGVNPVWVALVALAGAGISEVVLDTLLSVAHRAA